MLQNSTLRARLKCELLQRTGSFKVRGALNKLSSLTPEERKSGVIAISAGNHAQAVAYASALEGIDALIVMWEGASAQKIEATRGYGATVDLQATDPTDAFERLEQLQADTGRDARPPVRRPCRHRRGGDRRPRDRGRRTRRRRGDRAGRRRGPRERNPDSARRSCSRDHRRAGDEHRAASGDRDGTPVNVTADVDRGRPERAVRRCPAAPDLRRPRARARHRGGDRGMRSDSSMSGPSSRPSRPARRPPRPGWSGRIDADRPVIVVSGGNVAAETAAAILARR